MKRTIAILAAVTAIAALPVVDAAAKARSAAASQSIAAIASSNPKFSTLVKLLKAAGLVSTLSGMTDYTVFAPTNAAFAKVPAATLTALAANKAKLKAVLLYHVVAGVVPAAKVVTLHSAKTVEGATVKIRVSGGSVYVNQAKVIQTDIHASNGIIHVINAVLLPPAM